MIPNNPLLRRILLEIDNKSQGVVSIHSKHYRALTNLVELCQIYLSYIFPDTNHLARGGNARIQITKEDGGILQFLFSSGFGLPLVTHEKDFPSIIDGTAFFEPPISTSVLGLAILRSLAMKEGTPLTPIDPTITPLPTNVLEIVSRFQDMVSELSDFIAA